MDGGKNFPFLCFATQDLRRIPSARQPHSGGKKYLNSALKGDFSFSPTTQLGQNRLYRPPSLKARKAPRGGALWLDRRALQRRSFILCENRTPGSLAVTVCESCK